MPAAAAAAARAVLDREEHEGRVLSLFELRAELRVKLRAAYARRLGCDAEEVALTTSTSEGLGLLFLALGLGPGDEIVTSTEEHPGLIGPLLAARARGATITAVPFDRIKEAVTGKTRLVACSHVSWINGRIADVSGLDVPVILDGAQGAGAIPVDVRALGCAAYAAAGQKWMCGADGSGMLFLSPEMAGQISPVAPNYYAFVDASRGLEAELRADVPGHDVAGLSAETLSLSVAAEEVLAEAGWDTVLADGPARAARLAEQLAERGKAVAPRDHSTLVSWEEPDIEHVKQGCLEHGVVIRDLPGTPYVRASVGAWSDDDDVERLLRAIGAA